jgi:SAM-dependent methyltransferase
VKRVERAPTLGDADSVTPDAKVTQAGAERPGPFERARRQGSDPLRPAGASSDRSGSHDRDEPLRQNLAVDHRDHVSLIREGVLGGGTTWADLGSGEGAFTLALADLLGPTGSIHTVDRDGRALQVQLDALRGAFPTVSVRMLCADFRMQVELPPLDGIVMANSLHFERDKLAVLRLVRGYLRPAGRLVLVEYDTDRGNPWVPFPLSFPTWKTVAAAAGFRETKRLGSVPSRFLGSIYSALSLR